MELGGGIHQSYFIIDRAAFNQGKNAQYTAIIAEGGVMPSLVARGPHAVAIPNSGKTKYYLTDKGGHHTRWKLIDKAYTIHESDYKDPPTILVTR